MRNSNGIIENPESTAERMGAAVNAASNEDIAKGIEEIKELISGLFMRLDEVEESIFNMSN